MTNEVASRVDLIIEKQILRKPNQYIDPVYREYWRTSNFGRCYRMQYWYRKGEDVTNDIPMKSLKIFRIGDLFHKDIQQYLPQDQVEVEFKQGGVFGHADYVGDDFVEDFKTVGTFPWKLMQNPKFNVEKDKTNYILQLMAYCLFFEKPRGILTFINKDNYETKSYEFQYSDWASRVKDEIMALNVAWSEGTPPPAVPRAYNFKDCSYCPFQDKCDAVEGNTAKDRYEATRPQKKKVF